VHSLEQIHAPSAPASAIPHRSQSGFISNDIAASITWHARFLINEYQPAVFKRLR